VKQTKVAIIGNADDPKKAEFLKREDGKRRLFNSHAEAEEWLADHASGAVDYRLFDGTD